MGRCPSIWFSLRYAGQENFNHDRLHHLVTIRHPQDLPEEWKKANHTGQGHWIHSRLCLAKHWHALCRTIYQRTVCRYLFCTSTPSTFPNLHLLANVGVLSELSSGYVARKILFITVAPWLTSIQAITWGILIMFYISYGCSFINGTAAFRIPWGLQMIPAICLFIGMCFLPESPRWLARKDRWEDCHAVLTLVHGKGDPTVPSSRENTRTSRICANSNATMRMSPSSNSSSQT